MLGRGSFAQTNGDVLDMVRRVVKSGRNGSGKRRVHSSQSA